MNNHSWYLFTILFILLSSGNVLSQISGGANSISMANSDLARNKDVFSIFKNPAGLALNKNRNLGIFHSPFPFGIKELANSNLVYLEPTSFGNFSMAVSIYGFDLYKENQLRLGYANKIVKDLYMGISVYYHSVTIKRYGASNQINFSLGSIFLLSEKLSLGFSLQNPLRFNDSKIILPLIYSLGISFEPLGSSFLNFSLAKEINFPISAHFGIEYPIIKNLSLRIGTQTEPNLYSAGLGISYSLFTFNYAVNSHLELGLTHQFDLIIRLN